MTQLVRYDHAHDVVAGWLGWEPSRLVSSYFGRDPFLTAPALQVQDHGDSVVVTADLPGIGPDDVQVTFEAGVLTIRGKRDDRAYQYSSRLGGAIDPDRMEASLDKGVLVVTAWKSPAARPKRIPIGSTRSKASGGKRWLFWRRRR